jgi:hypothetical protein
VSRLGAAFAGIQAAPRERKVRTSRPRSNFIARSLDLF